jgi:hypothetical protein
MKTINVSSRAQPINALLRVQFGLRALLVLVVLAALLSAKFSAECRNLERCEEAVKVINDAFPHTLGGAKIPWPWYSRWLHSLLGHPEGQSLDFLVFSSVAVIDDQTLQAICHFPEVGQLWLNGDIGITDDGLACLGRLRNLHSLDLHNARVTASAVERLRQALPGCTIAWELELSPGIE